MKSLLMSLMVSVLLLEVGFAGEKERMRIQDFESQDIRNRMVSTRELRGKILILGFSNQETSDQLIEWQTLMGYETGVILGGYDQISILSIADVSQFPWLLRPIVRSRVEKIYEKANARLFQRFQESETTPPPDLGDRLYLIPDWSGNLRDSFGIKEAMDRAHLFIINPIGIIEGHFMANGEDHKEDILHLVRGLLNRSQLQPLAGEPGG